MGVRTGGYGGVGFSILVGVVMLVGGCAAADPLAEVPAAGAAGSSVQATDAPATTSVGPVDYQHPRTGPSQPEFGTPYPYDLFVHCGGEFATFGGRLWQTNTPPGQVAPRPEADGTTRVTGYVAGTMELLADNQARFTVDQRFVTTNSPVILFSPTSATQPLCK